MTTTTEPKTEPANLAQKLAAAAVMVGPIAKDQHNKQQNFDFRSIEAIVQKANKAFGYYGIAVLPTLVGGPNYEEVTSGKGTKGWRCTVTMQYEFTDGHDSRFASIPSEAIDYGDKATSKAVQMAYKYALIEVLMIGGDDDADAYSPQVSANGVDAVTWLRDAVDVFRAWDDDAKREAGKQAAAAVGAQKPPTLDEAHDMFTHMQTLYYEAHPDEAPF